MKRARLLLLVLLLALGFSTVIYAATSTTTLRVAALVQSTASATATLLNFGTIDPAVSNAADASIVVTVPAQQPYTITLDGGFQFFNNIRNMGGFGGQVPYKLFQPNLITEWGDNGFGNTYPAGSPLNAVGTGSPQSHLVRGVTQPAPFPVSSGSLGDQVLVTVNF